MIPFCAVEGAAAAQADDRVDAERRGKRAPALDHRRVRVDVEVVERNRVHAGGAQQPQGPFHVARLEQARVGDEQRLREAQLAGDVAEALDSAGAEDEPRAKLEVERVRHGPNPPIVSVTRGCAPNPRQVLAGTPLPRAALAEARRAGLGTTALVLVVPLPDCVVPQPHIRCDAGFHHSLISTMAQACSCPARTGVC